MAQRLEKLQSPSGDHPNMRDLRIVLVGKNSSENNKVGNLILNEIVFGKKMFPDDVEERTRKVEGRNITVINTIYLLKSQQSKSQIEQKVAEINRPEPHVIILVLQHKDFNQRKRNILYLVLNCFGEMAMRHTLILTTDDEKHAKHKYVKENEFILQISTECEGGWLQLQHTQHSQILQKVEEIITRSKCKETQHSSLLDEKSRQTREDHSSLQYDAPSTSCSSPENQKLNLVLCGYNEKLTASMSKLLLRKNRHVSAHQESRSECAWGDVQLYGRQINLLELPALTRLSEEEVMRQTLHCVSLCHPGVHAFLIVVPVGLLTEDNKAEIEKIQRIFNCSEHFILLFTTELTDEECATEFVKSRPDSQKLISRCGGQYRVMGLNQPENSRQIPELLEYIEDMKTEPYSLQMYVKAQENRARDEVEEQHKKDISEMKKKIKELEEKILSEGAECKDDQDCLRIVLIGRTGNGKSATGNTILGKDEFVSKARTDSVTTACEKRVGEAEGRSVAVVDTPGLFDTTLENEQVVEEIMKCVSLSSPGPHVFVIVMSVGRFTKEESDTLNLIKKVFGPKAARFSIILFTRGDDLEADTIEDYVRESKSAELKNLIRDCGNRFLAFNNKDKRDKTQVIQLLKMIEEVKNANQGRYFTSSMFDEGEMSIRKRMEEIMQEREIQTEKMRVKYEREMESEEKERNEIRQKHDEEIKDMKNKHEDEARKQAEESNEFKERRPKTKISCVIL